MSADTNLRRVVCAGSEVQIREKRTEHENVVVDASAQVFLEFMKFMCVSGNVLELKSATGVISVMLAVQGCFVTATDTACSRECCSRAFDESYQSRSTPDNLDLIRRNVACNLDLILQQGGYVNVQPLEWHNQSHIESLIEKGPSTGFDFIVGCNIAQYVHTYKALMLLLSKVTTEHTQILLANLGNQGDMKMLATMAAHHGFRMVTLIREVFPFTSIIKLELQRD